MDRKASSPLVAVEVAIVAGATDARAEVAFRGVDRALVAAIRATMLSNVPALAMDQVDIERNTSGTPSMALRDRISLIALDSREAVDALVEVCRDCLGAGCGACAVAYTLDVRNPNVDPTKELRVTARDLEPQRLPRASGEAAGDRKGGAIALGSAPQRVLKTLPRPVDPCIVIAVLGPQQQLRLRAQASIGRHQRNARWAVCGPIAMRTPVDIRVDTKAVAALTLKERKQFVDTVCPRKVFDIETLAAVAPERCTQCRRCLEWRPDGAKNDAPPLVEITPQPMATSLVISAVGQLPALDVLARALDILALQAAEIDAWLRDAS